MTGDGPDVVVVGAGGDGPVLAWRLGSLGLDVLVLEAGPWHGNENWPDPHGEPGGELVEQRLTYTGGREGWETQGSRSMMEIGREKAEAILSADHAPLIDSDTDAELAAIEERWTQQLGG